MAVDPAAGAPGLTLGGAAAILPLAGIVTGATVIALAAAERPSFLAPPTLHGDAAWLAGPLGGRWSSLTTVVGSLRWDVTLVLAAMVVCWVLAVATVKHLTPVVIAVTAAIVVLTLAPPFSLTDTFNYLHYGRMLPRYGLDPYTSLPIQARGDPAYPYSTWHHLPSPYGPLFTLYTELLALFALPVAYWILKVSVALAALAVAALTVALAKKLQRDPAKTLAFVMLNPLVLVYGIGGVHNDVFFMALLLAGALLITSDREILGGGTLAAAAAVKLSAGLAIPILIAGSKHRVKAIIGVAIGGAFVLAATWLAFHGHLPNDSTQSKLVASLSLPNLAGIALGHGGLDAQLRGELEAALVLTTIALTVWTYKTRRWEVATAWALGLLIVTLGWAMPWYVLWLLPFAALMRNATARAASIALTIFLLAVWAPASAPLLHRMGAYPGRTATGQANARFMQRLLR